jgi:hypothetical protein
MWLQPSPLGDVPSSDILPSIQLPLMHSSNPIVRFLSLCKVALKLSAVLTIAGGVMALHYRKIIEVGADWYGDNIFLVFPLLCVGEAETGKSTSIKAALSITGYVAILTTGLVRVGKQ